MMTALDGAIQYELTSKIEEIDGRQRVVYGVAVYRAGCAHAADERDCCELPDISHERETARHILCRLAKSAVYPIHVRDVVADLLG